MSIRQPSHSERVELPLEYTKPTLLSYKVLLQEANEKQRQKKNEIEHIKPTAENAMGALAKLVCLVLNNNQIGDPGMIALSESFGKGALPQITILDLMSNQSGDAGLEVLATAFASGALAKLQSVYLSENPGNSEPVDKVLRERKK